MKIIFQAPNSPLSVINPSQKWLAKYIAENEGSDEAAAMEALAQKDVPTGCKYKIVEDSVIPTDRTFRNAWEVDEAELSDGVGADFGVKEPVPLPT